MNNISIFKACLVSLLIATNVFGQSKATQSDSYAASFDPGDELELTNQFGDVKISHWEKDSIRIDYHITATAKDDEFAQEFSDRIQIEIISVFNGYLVETQVEKSNNKWLKNWWNLNQPFNKPKVTVGFDITLPRNSKLEISNKYGDLLLPQTVEQLNAEVKYGDVRGGDILNYSTIQHSNGKLILNSFKGKIKARNVEIKIGESTSLDVTSSNSHFDMKTVESLNINSTHDEAHFENITKLNGTANNSDITIDNISGAIETTVKNSTLQFNKIENAATKIDIEQKSSSIEFAELPLAYRVKFTMEDGTVKLPSLLENLDVNMLDAKKNLREITGGQTADSLALQISITGNKGNIFIK